MLFEQSILCRRVVVNSNAGNHQIGPARWEAQPSLDTEGTDKMGAPSD